MGRALTGTLTWSRGTPFVKLTIEGRRRSFRLATHDARQVEERKLLLVEIVRRLRDAGNESVAESLCHQAATGDERIVAGVRKVVDGLVLGREKVVAPSSPTSRTPTKALTFRQVGEMWTSGELAQKFRNRVKKIDHTENIGRLERYVYPFTYDGTTIGEMPVGEFTTEHADAILAQQELPDGSVRHVAQVVSRVLKLAAYPLKAIVRSPLPQGWLPPRNGSKEKSYLFPDEEAAFQGNQRVPVVRRLLVGFCAREGLRKENAVTLRWSDLVFQADGAVMICLDKTKNGRGGSWVLDPGTAEALRRWRSICPSKTFVFPASALPQHEADDDQPLYADHLADQLRDGLRRAGVTREKLFERGANRIRLRAHDLRASFVTLALGPHEKTEAWVTTRTGHGSSQMVALYRRQANTAVELKLTWFKPLHEIIPELAALGAVPP